MKLALGGDHAGFQYKEKLKSYLESKGHEVIDFGPFSTDSVDYPDFVHPTATAVESKEAQFGILICGSGQGVCMTANKHQGIRAALCWSTDLAAVTRQHNDSNIICIAARFIAYELSEQIVETFLQTAFEGGRHQKRVDKISC
ncbi:MAG: ribose 5-phosphate isomerase B [Cyclobacteriaceae bacterium]|jgi:ribose 5-phosphate isomerase B